MNAVEIEEAVSRLAEAPFDPEELPFAFLEAFGNKPTTLKRLKSGSSNQEVSTRKNPCQIYPDIALFPQPLLPNLGEGEPEIQSP